MLGGCIRAHGVLHECFLSLALVVKIKAYESQHLQLIDVYLTWIQAAHLEGTQQGARDFCTERKHVL